MGDQKAEECNTDTAKDPPLPSQSRYAWKRVFSPLQLRTLSASLILLGFVVLLISVNTNNWLSDGRLATGLWGACMQPGCAANAESVASGKETLQVTRGMLITALFCAWLSVFLISVSFCQHRIFSFSLGRISAITSFAASIFVMIGMSVYTRRLLAEEKNLVVEAEWSFDAGWLSFPLLVLAGSVTVMLSYVES